MFELMRRFVTATVLIFAAAPMFAAKPGGSAPKDPRMNGAYTFERGGWTYVHLEGSL